MSGSTFPVAQNKPGHGPYSSLLPWYFLRDMGKSWLWLSIMYLLTIWCKRPLLCSIADSSTVVAFFSAAREERSLSAHRVNHYLHLCFIIVTTRFLTDHSSSDMAYPWAFFPFNCGLGSQCLMSTHWTLGVSWSTDAKEKNKSYASPTLWPCPTPHKQIHEE